jgi:hypothetical protein
MPHDKHGERVEVGDLVMIPARITALHLTTDYCNCELEMIERMPPEDAVSHMTLNTRQVIKPVRGS